MKPPLLFTHVYECKVFASIVCKAACAVRVAGALNGTWRACRKRVDGGEQRVGEGGVGGEVGERVEKG